MSGLKNYSEKAIVKLTELEYSQILFLLSVWYVVSFPRMGLCTRERQTAFIRALSHDHVKMLETITLVKT